MKAARRHGMRVIAGIAGGIPLKVPPTVTRPSTDRVREAVFSMLGGSLEGAAVLDIYAGSGAYGIESLSRGAREAVLVDANAGAAAVIQENLTRTKLPGGSVVKADAHDALRRLENSGRKFDVIFADPPYAKKPGDPDLGERLLKDPALPALLNPDGILVLESMMTKRAGELTAPWSMVRDRVYGSTRILLLTISRPPDLLGENPCPPTS